MKQWFKKMETWMGGGEGGGKAKSNLPLADNPGFDRGGNHAVQFFVNVKN